MPSDKATKVLSESCVRRIMVYETTQLCSHSQCCRMAAVAGGAALRRRLYRPSLPNSLGQRSGPAPATDRSQSLLRRRHGPLCVACLCPRGPDLLAREVLATSFGPPVYRSTAYRCPQGTPAPQPAALRPADQPVDPRPRRAGLSCEGLDAAATQRRGHPQGSPTPRHPLASRQALDHLSRPRLRAKKNARDRLIRLAQSHPEWVLGYQDETWWSRLAQPCLHAWTAN